MYCDMYFVQCSFDYVAMFNTTCIHVEITWYAHVHTSNVHMWFTLIATWCCLLRQFSISMGKKKKKRTQRNPHGLRQRALSSILLRQLTGDPSPPTLLRHRAGALGYVALCFNVVRRTPSPVRLCASIVCIWVHYCARVHVYLPVRICSQRFRYTWFNGCAALLLIIISDLCM